MANRKIITAVCAVLGIALITQSIFHKKHVISAASIDGADNENVNKIMENCLRDTQREEQFSPDEIRSFSTFYGDVADDEAPDLIVAMKFDNATLMALYTKEGSDYVYKCELGLFYDVDGVEFRYMDNLAKNAVFIREKIDGSLGSYEKNEFIRGYAVIDGEPVAVISLPADIETYWNDDFSPDTQSEGKWMKVTQKSKVDWVRGDCPEIILVKEQKMAVADGHGSEKINSKEEFRTEGNRTLTEKYLWSDKWQRFILEEKEYIPTGEKVAVLENLESLPYSLAGFNTDKSRVLFENGDVSVVDNSDLK